MFLKDFLKNHVAIRSLVKIISLKLVDGTKIETDTKLIGWLPPTGEFPFSEKYEYAEVLTSGMTDGTYEINNGIYEKDRQSFKEFTSIPIMFIYIKDMSDL